MTSRVSTWIVSLGLGAAVAAFALVQAPLPSQATPIYAIRAAQACNTCHIEPIGWLDPVDTKDRKCTLDCQGCHVSPTGAGLRTASGDYFGRETLPTFSPEPRPSAFGDPEKYRGKNDKSSEGRYRLWEGFSGWQRSGTTAVGEIKDRYGDIDPDRRFDVGFDGRLMFYKPFGENAAVFPMQADLHLMAKPSNRLRFYTTLALQGRRDRTIERARELPGFKELFTIRELVAQMDGLPRNAYVRAGRFTKPYGWRHPDHTISVRKPLSFDQFAQVFGIEGGINPNYPYANWAVFYQGLPSWPGEVAKEGMGTAFTAGYRDLGWQAGFSGEFLKLKEGDRQQMTFGPLWGLNLYPVTYMGEVDVRTDKGPAGADPMGVFAYNEFNWLVDQGVSFLVGHHWYRTNLGDATTERWRLVGGAQWDVLPHTQLALEYRTLLRGADLVGQDVLLWLHVWL